MVMIRTTSYQLNIEIEQPRGKVFDYFSDLQNHVYLHPLLTKVTLLEEFHNNKGQIVSVFEIQERIRVLGFITVPNTYTAHRILLEEPKTCIFEVKSFPWVQLSASYMFVDEGINKTKIQEDVRVKAPWGLSGFVTKTAKKAHHSLLRMLKEQLEESSVHGSTMLKGDKICKQ